jgi:hypothetical protein
MLLRENARRGIVPENDRAHVEVRIVSGILDSDLECFAGHPFKQWSR